jgi:hypothetical protein
MQQQGVPVSSTERPAYSTLNPLKGVSQTAQRSYRTMTRQTALSKETANQTAASSPLANIPIGEGIAYTQGNRTPSANSIRTVFDGLHREAEAAGIKANYRENYLPLAWENSRAEIIDAVRRYMIDKGMTEDGKKLTTDEINSIYSELSNMSEEQLQTLMLTPTFAKSRAFPDYATGVQYGLRPRFQTVGQLHAFYKEQIGRARANRTFIEELKKNKELRKGDSAPPSWITVEVPFLSGHWKAEPNLARMLNERFPVSSSDGTSTRFIRATAKASKLLQEIRLSAGIPGTSANFFTFGQLVKGIASFDRSVIPAFMRSQSMRATMNEFTRSKKEMLELAERGPAFDRTGDFRFMREGWGEAWEKARDKWKSTEDFANVYNTLRKRIGHRASIVKDLLGFSFDRTFNEKTFSSFMSLYYLSTYKNAKKYFMKKGMNETMSADNAAELVKKFHGLSEDIGRSGQTKDFLSAVLFAPRFRESLITFWLNNAKSVTSGLLDPTYRKNRHFLIGSAMMFAAYQAFNKQLTGHYMWENPPGKELDLMVPGDDGENFFVSFLPSIAAFPRMMATGTYALARGDIPTATQKFGGLFSMPVKAASEVASNRDFANRPIMQEGAPFLSAGGGGKIAAHLGYNYMSHPYISEAIKYGSGQTTGIRAILSALEVPVRAGNDQQIERTTNWERLNELEAKKNNYRQGWSDDPLTDEEQAEIKELGRWRLSQSKEKKARFLNENQDIADRWDQEDSLGTGRDNLFPALRGMGRKKKKRYY